MDVLARTFREFAYLARDRARYLSDAYGVGIGYIDTAKLATGYFKFYIHEDNQYLKCNHKY